MVLELLGPLLLGAGIVLISLGVRRDPRAKILQKRINTEMRGEEEPGIAKPKWVRAAKPLIQFNERLLSRKSGNMRELFLTGRVNLTKPEFMVVKEVAGALGVVVYLSVTDLTKLQPGFALLAGFAGFMLPELWLRQRIKKRQRTISRDLPEIADLLTLCIDAGSDLLAAMSRVVKEFRPCPLRDELTVLVQEIRLGKRRRDAFQSLANRVRMQEVSAFVRVLVHADRMGMGMSQAMAVVSEDSRLRRYHQAERFAQQAPLKMLLPLIFIMFAVLTMVAGPVLLRFFRGELFPKL